MTKSRKDNNNKILRSIKRYSDDEAQRPRRKIRLAVLSFALLISWCWTYSPEVSGIAWMIFLVTGIFIVRDLRYLMGRNPMDEILRNMNKQFEEHSDY